MGYTHGTKWDENKIKDKILQVANQFDKPVMPTQSQLKEYYGDCSLTSVIAKTGGYEQWANKLNLKMTDCETRLGKTYENECIAKLADLGYDCEFTATKYPYDILVNNIKVDVKVSNMVGKTAKYFSFNLGKQKPTCDIFVCYCLEFDKIIKTYIIPACVLQGKNQLSVGIEKSKYDKYIDNWDIFNIFDLFYASLLNDYANTKRP